MIENAEKIGVLPNDVSEAISMDAVGSIDNELDQSDPSHSFKSKKKKHRSGSLTSTYSNFDNSACLCMYCASSIFFFSKEC